MKYTIGLFLLISILGCSKDEITTFHDNASIRLVNNLMTINQTFVFEKSDYIRDTIWLEVETSGDTAAFDRPFTLEQINEYPDLTYIKDDAGRVTDSVIDAVAGKHYLELTNPYTTEYMKIKAGRVNASIPVVLLRHSDLSKNIYRLKVELKPSEYFAVDFTDNYASRKILFSDKPQRPASWFSRWGTYSDVKMRFIVDQFGLKLTNENILAMDYAERNFWANQFQIALDAFNAGKPREKWLKDENGQFVSFTK